MIVSVCCLVLILFVNCDFSEGKPFDIEDNLLVTLNKPRSKIRGHILRSYEGRDFYAFQDIPYAVPPVGKLRFREPLPHPGWEGTLNTTTNSKVCVQFGTGQEDCLILNVFTPVAPGKGKLPVLVWIHGGAFLSGQCNLNNCGPHYFMDNGIIVVTLHYRVGPFGFLTTEDGVIPGNIGLKDQLLALKWVNKNIAVFGGDPTKVTIGGQSAGSISVSSHVISQKATGLFRAAIMQSGTALVHGSYISTARDYAFQVGRILQKDFNNSNSHDLLRILQKAAPKEILKAAFQIQPKVHNVGLLPDLLWALVVERQGENPYITVPFHQSVLEGKFDKIPILTGFMSEEILSFIDSVKQVQLLAEYHDKNGSTLAHQKLNIDEHHVPIFGEHLKKMYTNSTFSSDLRALIELSSETGLVNPTIRQAALSAKHVPVYLYEFSYEGIAHSDYHLNISNVDGCAHSEELAYMWPLKELVAPADRHMSNIMIKLWKNFIKALNPTPDSFDPILKNFQWPTVTDVENLEFVNINSTLTLARGPKKYKAVKELYEKYVKPPYFVF